MKLPFALLALLLFSVRLFSQEKSSETTTVKASSPAENLKSTTPEEEKTFEMFDIQKQPTFPGGEANLYKFISDSLQYPVLAQEKMIQGSVVVSFVIDHDGSIKEVKILKDIGGGCGKEAARIVSIMPRWVPGEADGKPVRVRFTLPFRFKLS